MWGYRLEEKHCLTSDLSRNVVHAGTILWMAPEVGSIWYDQGRCQQCFAGDEGRARVNLERRLFSWHRAMVDSVTQGAV